MMSFEVAPSPMRAFVTELEYLVDTFIKSGEELKLMNLDTIYWSFDYI